MSLLPVGISGESQYQISRSLRFNSADSAYLNRTPASAGNQKTWTWSGWVKGGALGSSYRAIFTRNTANNDSSYFSIQFGDTTNPNIWIANWSANLRQTTAVFRDPSAWYHIVLAIDTTQATADNRIRLYVNGVEQTTFTTKNNPTLNADLAINGAAEHRIGAIGSANYLSGYLTEINFIDGQALTPSSFGETNPDTGVWQPIKYTGTYGTNGFYLNFSDNSGVTSTTLGKDYSGNGNNWTPNNFSVTAGAGNDSLVDTPTPYGTDTGVGGEVRGNYATLNPVFKHAGWTSSVPTNGNLDNPKGSHTVTTSTTAINGKIYWEVTVGNPNQIVGIISSNPTYTGTYSYDDSSAKGVYCWTVTGYVNGSGVVTSGGPISSFSGTATFMFAVDTSTNNMWVGKDGVWNGDPSAGTGAFWTNLSPSLTYVPWIHSASTVQDNTASCNFGQRPFAYTAPSGFKALCTQNLPEPTIKDGGDYFAATIYSGTAGVAGSVTGVGFQPDLVWVKARSGANGHVLVDAVRGVQKGLFSAATTAEVTSNEYLLSFDSDGFSYGVSNSYSQPSMVSWNWKANGAGSSNTDGTITSTVSVNTTSGFSIVTYTGNGTAGATVGHGLGVAPSMIIVKNRTAASADDWAVYHQYMNATPQNGTIYLNLTNAYAAVSMWNSTAPTSSVVSIGSHSRVNANTNTYVAYCFANVSGYSQAFSFSGNGSTDGSFVFLGFRPAWVLIKRTDTTSNWTILDFQREGYNVDNDPLYPNLSNAEGTTDLADLLSNGFKLRTTDASVNASGGTYIGFAVAQNPFKYSLGR